MPQRLNAALDLMINESWYEECAVPTSEWEKYACEFVQLLIMGEFDRGYACLTPALQARLKKSVFIRRFRGIVSTKYVPLARAWVIMSMTGYPDAVEEEVGMAYIQVGGDNNEAMTVFVFRSDSGYVVGNLEWGRP